MLDSPDQPLSLLGDRYRITRILSEGGFGTTYLAIDTLLPSQRKCVVKQLRPIEEDAHINTLVQERFEREAVILESLGGRSDQIPSLYAQFVEKNVFYLVEEWIEGDTLIAKIQKEGLLSENAVQKILISLLKVLSDIHAANLLHRDIKPDNIILRWQDGKPVLIDFGAVKETMGADQAEMSSASVVVGTPGFMPAEQITGQPVDASDLYSLGVTAIYLLTGNMPQELDTDLATGQYLWHHLVPGLSSGFMAVIDQATQTHAHDRFPTAEEMLQALQSHASSDASVASFQPIPTAISTLPTDAVQASQLSGQYATQISQPASPVPKPKEWYKPIVTGGLIGLTVLGASTLAAQHLPQFLAAYQDTPEESAPTVSPPPQTLSPSIAQPPIPADPLRQPAVSMPTNATVMGRPGAKNIRLGVGTQQGVVGKARPGDRVQVLKSAYNADGYLWYQIFAPKTTTEGWIASHLVDVDAGVNTLKKVRSVRPRPIFKLPLYKRPQYRKLPVFRRSRRGYCTFLANDRKHIVNDPCTIADNKAGTYQIRWSDGISTTITTEPKVAIDGVPAVKVQTSATSLTVSGKKGKVGFCWDCNLDD